MIENSAKDVSLTTEIQKDSLAKDTKEVTEVIRSLIITITTIQRGISRTVVPYFLLTVFFFLTIFNTNLPSFASFQTVYYGGYISNSGEYVGGVKVTNIRSVSIFIIATVLFYMFVRFGYLYYQGNKLIATIHLYLGENLTPLKKHSVIKSLRHVCKENYLIQALVVMRKNAAETGLEGSPSYIMFSELLSCFILVLFVVFIGFSQYLTVLYLANTFLPLAVLVLILYVAYYWMFMIGLIFEGVGANRSTVDTQNFGLIFITLFTIFIILNLANVTYGFYQGINIEHKKLSIEQIELNELPLAYKHIFASLAD